MSFHAVTAAIAIGSLEVGEKFLLVIMASYAGPDNTLFPSQQTLAEDTGMSERAVRGHMKTLEARGLIRRKPRYVGNRRTSDFITLLFVPAKSAATNAPPVPAKNVTSTGRMRQTVPADFAGEPIIEPRIESKRRTPAPSNGAASSPEEDARRKEVGNLMKGLVLDLAANRKRK